MIFKLIDFRKIRNWEDANAIYQGELVKTNLQNLMCPDFQKNSCFKRHGYYKRKLRIFDGKIIFIRIFVVKCSSCRKVHSILPSFIVPYKFDYQPAMIEVTKDYLLRKKTIVQLLEKFIMLNLEMLKHHLRLLKKKFKCYLENLYNLDLEATLNSPTLINDYIKMYNFTFMQNLSQKITYY